MAARSPVDGIHLDKHSAFKVSKSISEGFQKESLVRQEPVDHGDIWLIQIEWVKRQLGLQPDEELQARPATQENVVVAPLRVNFQEHSRAIKTKCRPQVVESTDFDVFLFTGLGALIVKYGNRYDTASMFVPILVLMLLGITLTWLVRRAEERFAPWRLTDD
jgi:hypothetical protein